MVNPLYNATPETPSKAATDLISTENFQVSIISKQNFYTVSDWVVEIYVKIIQLLTIITNYI